MQIIRESMYSWWFSLLTTWKIGFKDDFLMAQLGSALHWVTTSWHTGHRSDFGMENNPDFLSRVQDLSFHELDWTAHKEIMSWIGFSIRE